MHVAERVLGIAADRGVGHPDGRYGFGSGFLVAGRAVLTCAHVVAGAREVLLNDAVGNEYTGHVAHLGDRRPPGTSIAPDLAIVEIDDPAVDASPFPIAEIDRTGMGTLESVRIVGWPRFMDTADKTGRSTYSAVGTIEDMTRRREGLLRVDVSGSPPANVEPGSPWQGFSGAPVFADGHLVGVVTTHGLPEGPSALTAIPLTVNLPDGWRTALRATHVSPLHIVRPGPAGPPCVVHHQTVLRSLNGYRSSLLYDVMPYVEPHAEAVWRPSSVWQRLRADDGPNAVLVSGHGGIGKTRTLLEVAGMAVEDGWTVLHVRAGNAARVVDHLTTFVRSSFAPVLLVVDYLNQSLAKDLDLPQLLALIQQNRRGSGPHLAVLASARTGWLLTPAHAREVVALEQIQLAPEAADLRAICASLAQAVAPRAAEQLGLDTLLGYTDAVRPILTLLVARQIEDRVTRGLALPRATMDAHDLRQWLELRLDEDQLVPRLDSPESLWGPEVEVHIRAAAAVFLATPGTEATLVETASHIFNDGASAANLLRLLIKMGWLISSDGGLDSVHDVVTDFLVSGVVFWSTTGALRQALTAQLMDAVGQQQASLEHALVALGRLVDDIDERERAVDLVGEIDRWFGEHRESVVRLLLQDKRIGARTAAVLVSSGMLTTTRQAYWDHAFGPLLTALGREPEAFSLLLAAVRAVPLESRDVVAELADHAIAWLTGRPLAGVEQLLRLLLRRDDLPPDRARAAVRLANDWLRLHSRDARSDVLLSSTLMCDIVDHEADADLERLTGFALQWLAANGTQLRASYLLRAMSRVKHLPDDVVGPLVSRALSWLGTHGETIEASFVLPGFLNQTAVPQKSVTDFVGAARAWLAHHQTRPEANYVLAHLLTRHGLDAEVVSETFDHTREWIKQNSNDPSADYLVQRALAHPALPTEMAGVVYAAASEWLASYGSLETATYLLQVLVPANGLPEDLRATTFTTARTWLQTHGQHLTANYLLQVLVAATGLPEDLRATTFTTARTWLHTHGQHLTANYLLQVLLPATGLPEDLRATTFTTAQSWLHTHGQHVDAAYLLQVLLPATGLPEDLRATTFTTARTWLHTHGRHHTTRHLLAALLQTDGLPEDLRTMTFSSAQASLQTHGQHLTAIYLLQVLLPATGLPEDLRATTFATARTWLHTHGQHHTANYLLQMLLPATDLPEDLRTTTFTTARTWLHTHGHHLDAAYLLQVLLPATDLTEDLRTTTFTTAQSWLHTHGRHHAARHLLEALLQTDGLPADLRTTTFTTTQTWLRTHGQQLTANYLLQVLLPINGLPEDLRTTTFTTAQTWLHTHGQHHTARHLLEALLQTGGLPADLRTTTFTTAQSWLHTHGRHHAARHLLEALLQTGGLPADLRTTTFTTTQTWLRTHGQQLTANYLLQVLLPINGLPEDLRTTTFTTAQTWLHTHGQHHTARHLLEALLRIDVVPAAARELFVDAAVSWLDLWWQEASAVSVLSALLRIESPGSDAADHRSGATIPGARLVERALQWLSRFGSATEARSVLGLLLRSPALEARARHQVLQAAVVWLNEHADSPRACEIISAVLGNSDVPKEMLVDAFEGARIWLSRPKPKASRARPVIEALFRRQPEYPEAVRAIASQYLIALERGIDTAQTRFALAAFLTEPLLDGEVRETVLRLTREWLVRFAELPSAHLVLGATASRGDLTADEVRWFERFVAAWLGENSQAPPARPLAQALLDGAVTFPHALHGELLRIAQASYDDSAGRSAGTGGG
ncbi:serine protease [Micromonospora sp. NPDC049049]|uniref:serine protease n=1 Tax=Micromonospora sp. NPDC049049 TaxID=3155495 RepID=UPI0033E63CE2